VQQETVEAFLNQLLRFAADSNAITNDNTLQCMKSFFFFTVPKDEPGKKKDRE
jgi:hypothetical protein